MKTKTQFIIGAFGIIFNEQKRILLVHRRDYDLWNLPGGGLEDFESPTNAVKREVKEETGLEVEISRLLGVYNKENKNSITFTFLCKVIGGKITLNDEADRIEYFEIDKLPENTVPKHVERIKDALLDQYEVIFKTQTGKSAIELVNEGKL